MRYTLFVFQAEIAPRGVIMAAVLIFHLLKLFIEVTMMQYSYHIPNLADVKLLSPCDG